MRCWVLGSRGAGFWVLGVRFVAFWSASNRRRAVLARPAAQVGLKPSCSTNGAITQILDLFKLGGGQIPLRFRVQQLVSNFPERAFGVIQESVKFPRIKSVKPFGNIVGGRSRGASNLVAETAILRRGRCGCKCVHALF